MMFRSRELTTLFRKIASTQRTYPFPHPSYHLPISLQSFRTFSDHVERMNHSVHKRRNTIKNDEEHKEERKTEALKSNKDRTFQILSSKLIPKEKLQTLSNSKLLSLLNSSSPHRLVHDADMTSSPTRRRQGKEEEDSSILRENVHLLSNLIMDRLTNEITTPEYIFPSLPDILIILEAFVNAKCVSTDFHSFLTKALQHYFPPQASAKFSAFSCFESLSFPEYCKFFVNLALLEFHWNGLSKKIQVSILYGILYYQKEIKTVPLESLCHLVEAIHLFRIDSFPTAWNQSTYHNILWRILNENYSTNGQKYNIINPLLYQFFTPKRYRYTSEKRKKLNRRYFREEELQNILKGIHLHSHSFHGSSFIVNVCGHLHFQYSVMQSNSFVTCKATFMILSILA